MSASVNNESVDTGPSLLNGMGGKIKGEALVTLLARTLTTLEKAFADLESLLDNELWDEAGEKAHQLKGSAYLYGCGEVLFFLNSITEKNAGLIGSATFKNNFRHRSNECLDRLQLALDNEGKPT